jgi:beta-glucosidase
VTVQNVGDRDGDEVVQLYVRDVVACRVRPVKELKGFQRLTLKVGEAKRITFTLSADQLAFYDEAMRLIVEPGTFEVQVGSSSEDIRLRGTFEVVGEMRLVANPRTLLTAVSVSEATR